MATKSKKSTTSKKSARSRAGSATVEALADTVAVQVRETGCAVPFNRGADALRDVLGFSAFDVAGTGDGLRKYRDKAHPFVRRLVAQLVKGERESATMRRVALTILDHTVSGWCQARFPKALAGYPRFPPARSAWLSLPFSLASRRLSSPVHGFSEKGRG